MATKGKNIRKQKALKPKIEGSGSAKGGTEGGKGKRIPEQPPGMPGGKHHTALGKDRLCLCGRCTNDKLGQTYAASGTRR